MSAVLVIPVHGCLSILQSLFQSVCVVCSVCANYALDICSRTACVYNSMEVKEVN